jgi:hypothetical protein
MAAELVSPLRAPGPVGVMTDEEGVVTGDLELRTTCADDGALDVVVRYAGALDWYRITGASGVRLADPADHEAVHALLRGVLHRPEG